ISGILYSNRRSICSTVVSPNVRPCHPLSSRDRKGPSRMIPTSPSNPPAAGASSSSECAPPPTLLSVLTALEHGDDLSPNRRRDLRSAVTRMAKLMGEAPDRIALDLPAISAKLVAVNAAAV